MTSCCNAMFSTGEYQQDIVCSVLTPHYHIFLWFKVDSPVWPTVPAGEGGAKVYEHPIIFLSYVHLFWERGIILFLLRTWKKLSGKMIRKTHFNLKRDKCRNICIFYQDYAFLTLMWIFKQKVKMIVCIIYNFCLMGYSQSYLSTRDGSWPNQCPNLTSGVIKTS